MLVGCVLAERVVLVLEKAVGRRNVDGCGCCVRIVVSIGGCGVGFNLGQMVENELIEGRRVRILGLSLMPCSTSDVRGVEVMLVG